MSFIIYVGSDLVLSTHVEEDGERKLWESFHLIAISGNKTYIRRLEQDEDEALANQVADVFQEQAQAGTFNIHDGWKELDSYTKESRIFHEDALPDWN